MQPNVTLPNPQVTYPPLTMQPHAHPMTYAQAANPHWQWNPATRYTNQAYHPQQQTRQETTLPRRPGSGT